MSVDSYSDYLVDRLPNFTDKHVQIYIYSKPGISHLLQDITFEIQGGRLFLTGTNSEAYEPHVWGKGRPCVIAWDCVEHYLVFDSAEQYRDEMKRQRAAAPKKSWFKKR